MTVPTPALPGRVESILPEDVPELARFLAREQGALALATGHPGGAVSVADFEARLRWRLVENPSRGERSMGDCVRAAADGRIVASTLHTPTAFRFGAARVMGLLGGGFFVAADARGGWGRVMFDRFTAAPGCDFAYSTSLNAASSGFWKRAGGVVPRGCDREPFVALALRPVVAELAARHGAPALLRGALAAACAAAEPIWRLAARGGAAPALVPCEDWERLAAVAERERDAAALVADLTAAVLAWRYAASPARERIEALRFEAGGAEGWLATIASVRGLERGIRTRTVTTLVRPRAGFDEPALLRALCRRYRDSADLLVLGVTNAWTKSAPPQLLDRRLEPSPVYAGGNGGTGLAWAKLLQPSVGDGDALE